MVLYISPDSKRIVFHLKNRSSWQNDFQNLATKKTELLLGRRWCTFNVECVTTTREICQQNRGANSRKNCLETFILLSVLLGVKCVYYFHYQRYQQKKFSS